MVMTFTAFLLAITLKYIGQTLFAAMLGDGSSTRSGRMTFRLAQHLSPLGTIVALVSAFPISTGIPVGLGWGKIVRPNATKMSIGPNLGVILIGLSGIIIHFTLGIGSALLIHLVTPAMSQVNILCSGLNGGVLQGCLQSFEPGWFLRLDQFVLVFANVNIVLGLLNIIPLFPLDGYHILFSVLPAKTAMSYRSSESTQELIVLLILFLAPLLFSLVGIGFNPIGILNSASLNIIAQFSSISIIDTLLRL